MTPERAYSTARSGEDHEPRVIPTPKWRLPVGVQPVVLGRGEEEIATLVARGLSNRQVASELHLSERTIEDHASRILRKLEVSSLARVAAWAAQKRLPAAAWFRV